MNKLTVINKIKVPAGLNLLCLAAAGYVATEAFVKLNNWLDRKKEIQILTKATENLTDLVECLDSITVEKESVDPEIEKDFDQSDAK